MRLFWMNRLAAAALALSVSAGVLAHGSEWFDTHPTPHGGQVRMAGPYHFELMPHKRGVLVYVTDHGDTPIPTAGWTAQIIALSAGKKVRITLKSAGDNKLSAEGSIPAGAQAVLSASPKAGEEYSARFPAVPTR
jgi:hypothetical protein